MNKLNIARTLGKILLTRTGLGYRRRNNTNYARKMWRPLRNTTNARRRIANKRRNNTIEINNAEGGYKQVYTNNRVQQQTIEFYKTIQMDRNANYVFEGNSPLAFDVAAQLNDTDEFLELRRTSLQYKVVFVDFSFNYNRVPIANEKFSKMLMTPETDMVLQNNDPKINKNTMVWDMTKNGTKNYNFRINTRNTEKENQEWQIAESFWNAILKLHISSQGLNELEAEPLFRNLGELKISISVIYVKADETQQNRQHLPLHYLIKVAAEKIRDEEELKVMKMKMETNRLYLERQLSKNRQLEDDIKMKEMEVKMKLIPESVHEIEDVE
jgi:hypothetical protein